MNKLRLKINDFKCEIKEIIIKFNKVISNLETYYNITNNIINNYNENKKNYQILTSINNINDYNEIIINDIDKIIKEEKLKNKVNNIVDIYEKMNIYNDITLKYNIKNKNKIRLFGDIFVHNNKENFKLLINGKINELTSFLDLKDSEINNEIIEIKLREIKNPTDISYMFSECESLISIENLSNLNTINIINMAAVFSQCTSLICIPDISNWNTYNVKK